jgi:hypothetical protein
MDHYYYYTQGGGKTDAYPHDSLQDKQWSLDSDIESTINPTSGAYKASDMYLPPDNTGIDTIYGDRG